MFSIDTWQEIWSTVRKNKLRTFLTAFSVAWGIFLLIFLIGTGTGFKNGVIWEFRDDASNALFIDPGTTSLAYDGLSPGRSLRFTDEDIESVSQQIEGVEYLTARYYVRGNRVVLYKNEKASFSIRSVHPDHKYLENTIMQSGRFLNELDLIEKRKVAVIGQKVNETLFKEEDPLGKWINVNGIMYKVIGVFEDVGGEGEMSMIYLPLTTAQMAYGAGNYIDRIMFTMDTKDIDEALAIESATLDLMSRRHHFDKEDPRAINLFNLMREFKQVMSLIDAINLALWIVGVFTIVAGIVGVGNIMLIVVKERTREIGVRKALGATPWSIIGLFMQEAVLITVLAGYLGLVVGLGLMEGIQALLMQAGGGVQFFRDPNVDVHAALFATSLLVVSGLLAGVFPAYKAAKLQPIDALRDE